MLITAVNDLFLFPAVCDVSVHLKANSEYVLQTFHVLALPLVNVFIFLRLANGNEIKRKKDQNTNRKAKQRSHKL